MLDDPHGQVRLLDAEPLPGPRAYDPIRVDPAAFAAVRVNPDGALVSPAASGTGIPPGMIHRYERAGLTSMGAAKRPLVPRQACGRR
jgi:hypothetical protein